MSRLIFSVNSQLDSWDMENLKYIRKVSKKSNNNGQQPLARRESENSLSYMSEEESKSSLISCTDNRTFFYPHQPPTLVVLEEDPPLLSHRPSSEYLPSTCYLLDVLEVANESVPRRDYSDGGSTTPTPSTASDDSFTSAIEKGFFDMKHSDGNQGLGEFRKLSKNDIGLAPLRLNLKRSNGYGISRIGGRCRVELDYSSNWIQLEQYINSKTLPRKK